MAIESKSFIYNTDVVSKKQFDEHMKLYKGYVDKTNEITKELHDHPDRDKANATYSKYRGLKKGETYALDGVILHECYFSNISSSTDPSINNNHMGIKTTEVFNKCFGGYDKWKCDMTACGKSARGWAILIYEQRTDTFRNILLDKHDEGVVCMGYPIIVLDMYEHAYFLDYGTDKNKYIDKFLNCIDWRAVELRIERIKQAD